jgi:hypothetical protein
MKSKPILVVGVLWFGLVLSRCAGITAQETEEVQQERASEENGKLHSDVGRAVPAPSSPEGAERYPELWVDLGGEG